MQIERFNNYDIKSQYEIDIAINLKHSLTVINSTSKNILSRLIKGSSFLSLIKEQASEHLFSTKNKWLKSFKNNGVINIFLASEIEYIYTIYGLFKPGETRPFYIGQTANLKQRLKNHTSISIKSENKVDYEKLVTSINSGLILAYSLLGANTETEANELEMKMIRLFKDSIKNTHLKSKVKRKNKPLDLSIENIMKIMTGESNEKVKLN